MKTIVVFLLLLFPLRVCAKVYKWVDANGTIHFSDTGMAAPPTSPQPVAEQAYATPTPASNQPGDQAETTPYVLEGSIIDPHRRLLQGIMEEGAKWSGTLDTIGRQMVSIRAYQKSVMLQSTHPDKDGGFRLSLSRPATHITLETDAGGLYVRKDGPWDKNAQVTLSLDATVFSITGYVMDIRDAPVSQEMVLAFDEMGKQLSYSYTNSKGYFEFNTNYPISVLKTRVGGFDITNRGNWNEDASITLTVKKESLFTISGVVRDRHEQPVSHARVITMVTGTTGQSAMTDNRGHYELSADRTVNEVHAYWTLTGDEAKKEGPFNGDSQVDLVFSKGSEFTITGRVTDAYGHATSGAFVFAANAKGYRLGTTRTDRNGHYALNLGKQASSMNASRVGQPKTHVAGLWNQDATVDIQLTQ